MLALKLKYYLVAINLPNWQYKILPTIQSFHQTTKIISHFVNTILRSSTVQDISTKTQGQLCASKLK